MTPKSFDIPKTLIWEAYKHVKVNGGAAGADSDEDAQAFRFDGALDSDMMSPRTGASLAGDWWHR